MRRSLIAIFIAAVLVGTAVAQEENVCNVGAACGGDVVTLTVQIQGIFQPDAYQGVIVYRSTLGQCDAEVALNADALLALPQQPDDVVVHTIDDPVLPGLGYQYRAVLLDLEGNAVPWFWPYSTYAVTGCGTWPISRGVLESADVNGDGWLMSCDCWFPTFGIDLSAIDPAVYLPLIGQMVELRGEARWDMMPGGYDVIVESIAPVASCDEPVGTRVRSWSSLKHLYD